MVPANENEPAGGFSLLTPQEETALTISADSTRSDPAMAPEQDPRLGQAVYYAAALVEALSEISDEVLEEIQTSSPFTGRMCHTHAVVTDTLLHLGVSLNAKVSTRDRTLLKKYVRLGRMTEIRLDEILNQLDKVLCNPAADSISPWNRERLIELRRLIDEAKDDAMQFYGDGLWPNGFKKG